MTVDDGDLATSPADNVSVATPPGRRAHSIRRTLSIQSSFPDGPLGNVRTVGKGRDLYTGDDQSDATALGEQKIDVTLSPEHRILSFENYSTGRYLSFLHGLTLGKEVREAVRAELAEELEARSLLIRLIEEVSAAAFLAPGSWFAWVSDPKVYRDMFGASSRLESKVEGLCISYAPGSVAVTPDGKANHNLIARHSVRLAKHASDPLDWHDFDVFEGPQFWRIRYNDVWHENDQVMLETGFQDSAALQDQTDVRGVYHEYRVIARIDPEDFTLIDADITPGSLPYPTCIAAPANVDRLIGRSVLEFGRTVPAELARVLGCTHLNEALKSFQDTRALVSKLQGEQ